MKIIIDYPIQADLTTRKVFTNFKERTKWIQETIRRKNLNESCNHHHTDFIVEFIRDIDDDIEYWGIGS
jgi:hypothetical protein